MHDNAPSHSSSSTRAFLASKGFNESNLMQWPSKPDLNCIENYWSIIKAKVDEGGRQYNCNDEQVDNDFIAKLTQLMDGQIMKVFEKKGSYIGH